jgi:hypothetical protein
MAAFYPGKGNPMNSWQSFRRLSACALMVLVASSVLLLAGCGSKVSKSNYDKLKEGMTMAEVEGILGKGTVTETSGGLMGAAKTEEWKDGDKSITAAFVEDKLVLFKPSGL